MLSSQTTFGLSKFWYTLHPSIMEWIAIMDGINLDENHLVNDNICNIIDL